VFNDVASNAKRLSPSISTISGAFVTLVKDMNWKSIAIISNSEYNLFNFLNSFQVFNHI